MSAMQDVGLATIKALVTTCKRVEYSRLVTSPLKCSLVEMVASTGLALVRTRQTLTLCHAPTASVHRSGESAKQLNSLLC